MADFSDIFGSVATLAVMVALSGILPIMHGKSPGGGATAPSPDTRPEAALCCDYGPAGMASSAV